MKFVSYINNQGIHCAGLLKPGGILDLHKASNGALPQTMLQIIQNSDKSMDIINAMDLQNATVTDLLNEVTLLPPLPNPPSFRDFIAFETHIKNAAGRFGDVVPKEWYEIPVFYFSNAAVMKAHGETIQRPAKCKALDYELEIAAIIGKPGINIKPEEADSYIFGYTILNDWTARDLQGQEMKVKLGPAKGKDFATSIGPYIITKDELQEYRTPDGRYDLTMTASVNGKKISDGNFKTIYHTFGKMIERASDDVMLYPGDVIGSGTVGWGCILELGTDVQPWLQPGDEVELSITALGSLKNRIGD